MRAGFLFGALLLTVAQPVKSLSCNYEGTLYNICKYANAWSYENGSVCVGITRCISQPSPFGVTTATIPPNTTIWTPSPTTTITPASTTPPPTTPPPTTQTPTTQTPIPQPTLPQWPVINGVQWADTSGNPIQAHGGGIIKVGEYYYWYGENRNPDSTFLAVSLYKSKNLVQWEHAHDVLTLNSASELNRCNVERPKIVYNKSTRKYVMWMHWENGQHYGEARAAVASCNTIDGDYTYHGSFRPYQNQGVTDHDRPGYMSRDCTLFVDDDNQAYFLSASNENYDLHLYSLTSDYLGIKERVAVLFKGGHREAPALFKKDGVYFLITSGSTGWDPNQAKYSTSASITSGWSSLSNVGDGNTFYSQSTFVLPVTATDGSGHTEYLYMGDRWAGSWGERVIDSSYVWIPISFNSRTTISMDWKNTIELTATSGTLSGSVNLFKFVNKKSGLALGVSGPADENNSKLVLTWNAQLWRFRYDGKGYTRLTSAAGSETHVIDVPNESTAAGIQLALYVGNDKDHQTWRLIDLGNGYYRVVNKKSKLAMAVSGGSTSVGATIEQQHVGNGAEQIWRIDIG